jgi:hypothetical protein
MKRKPVVKEWTEMAQVYLSDAPPKTTKHEAYLFLNYCKVTQDNGKQILTRRSDVLRLEAETQKELDQQILAFGEKDDVRLLAEGVETNQLPKRVSNVPFEIVFGEAKIYAEN